MKVLKAKRFFSTTILCLLVIGVTGLFTSCSDDILNETPKSSLDAENTLTTKAGFEAYLVGLVRSAREEYSQDDITFFITNFPGTDIGEDAGEEYFTYRNWISYLTPITPEVEANWNWAYEKMISQANTIITYANKPEIADIWDSEAEKNAVIAEARFFRGYTYNFLANLYGGVPIINELPEEPRYDYVRASRNAVYEFAKDDLEFASEWLPETVAPGNEGRIVKAAADHLLSEVYISLGDYPSAIQSASDVIDSELYHLMTTRFGSDADKPGDVFSDLFREGNQNRSSGNMESIYVWQFAGNVDGGGGSRGGNPVIRSVGPFQTKISAPDGVSNIPTDTLGRGVGRVRGTNYSIYGIWDDPNDIRNSKHNFRRTFYYNNPASEYFGDVILKSSLSKEDSLRNLYPYPRKIEGVPWENNNTSGHIENDVYVYRLAETYLLRAEAYFRNNQPNEAADDINEVRARAQVSTIGPGDVDLDFILDERARELMYETPRRRTLIRMGKLVERVREYGLLESSRQTIEDYHNLWPIPQEAIDANFGAELEQNPGYN